MRARAGGTVTSAVADATPGRIRAATVATVLLVLLPGKGPAQTHPVDTAAWRTDFSRHTVPLDGILPGGPPKDGIPALDRPGFVSVAEADRWLEPEEPVIAVVVGGRARAYPYQILIWHEIVNDMVGDLPLAVTYCPLCNTALVFRREHGGRVLDFGTTGRLRNSDLVMYDRQTESWWQQATGEGIVGELAGDHLDAYPAQTLSWASFREAHEGGQVLSRETGYDRPYGRNPYEGYDRGRGPIRSFFQRKVDGRLPAMERVAALPGSDPPVAYPFSVLRERRAVNDVLDGHRIVVLWAPGTASALDAGTVAGGRDVGASGVFSREVDGRTLSLRPAEEGRFVDAETGSTWDVAGRAVAGPLKGNRLDPLAHGDYFWFAWAAFRPRTAIRGR
jgi:hypothetical protein